MGGLPSDSPLGHQDTISLLAEFISTVRLTLTLALTRSLALALTLIVTLTLTLTLALLATLVFFRTSPLSSPSKFEDSWLVART